MKKDIEHNNITITDPWMIPYFQGGEEEASKYKKASNKKIRPICPLCGKVKDKDMMISTINRTHSIGCDCVDKTNRVEMIGKKYGRLTVKREKTK